MKRASMYFMLPSLSDAPCSNRGYRKINFSGPGKPGNQFLVAANDHSLNALNEPVTTPSPQPHPSHHRSRIRRVRQIVLEFLASPLGYSKRWSARSTVPTSTGTLHISRYLFSSIFAFRSANGLWVAGFTSVSSDLP